MAAGLMVVVGCSAAERPDQSSADIIHGFADTTVHNSVALLVITKANKVTATCTATLVAPNLALTARHCVSDTDTTAACAVDGTALAGGAIKSDSIASDLLIYTGTAAIQVHEDPTAAAARGAKIIADPTTTLCDSDVAFLLLDRDVNTPISPMRLREGGKKGELLTAVGWGLTEVGVLPTMRRQRPNVRVTAAGPLVLDNETNYGVGRSEFLVGEAFCSGDSGGPAFSSRGALVGVVSRGGNGQKSTPINRALGCLGEETDGTYTHLARKQDLITRAFLEAGHRPIEEGEGVDGGVSDAGPEASTPTVDVPDASPPPPPVDKIPDASPPGKVDGATCSANTECSSSACVDDKCRSQCTVAANCAQNQDCTTRGALKVCIPKAKTPDPGPPPVYTNYPGGRADPPTASTVDGPGPSAPPAGATPSKSSPAPAASAASSARPASAKPDIDSAGCSAAPSRTTSSASIPALALALAVVLGRRRRSRPTG